VFDDLQIWLQMRSRNRSWANKAQHTACMAHGNKATKRGLRDHAFGRCAHNNFSSTRKRHVFGSRVLLPTKDHDISSNNGQQSQLAAVHIHYNAALAERSLLINVKRQCELKVFKHQSSRRLQMHMVQCSCI
jgi:hypothetical protein